MITWVPSSIYSLFTFAIAIPHAAIESNTAKLSPNVVSGYATFGRGFLVHLSGN
jgi:hypothetical protein